MIDIEFPNKLTEILTMMAILASGLGFGHNAFKKIHIFLDRMWEKVLLIEKSLSKLEEKVDSNEKSTRAAFHKTNEHINEINIFNAKVESSLAFIKDNIIYHRVNKENFHE